MIDALLAPLQPLFMPAFTLWNTAVSALELLAFVLAVVMVVFEMRVNVAAWPLAILSSLLYFALFWNSGLYGDASLQIFFVAIGAWGWWQWLRSDRQAPAETHLGHGVRTLPGRSRVQLLIAFGLAWPATGLFLKTFTTSDVPWWDAFPTSLSLVGTWLLGRKYVENWPVWIAVNLVSIGLFAYKGLWLTMLLYGVFVVMSCFGWNAWRRQLATTGIR